MKGLCDIKLGMDKLSNDLVERFNYLKELYDLKLEIKMLKRKRGEIDILDIIKIIIAIILIYVIFEVVKSLS